MSPENGVKEKGTEDFLFQVKITLISPISLWSKCYPKSVIDLSRDGGAEKHEPHVRFELTTFSLLDYRSIPELMRQHLRDQLKMVFYVKCLHAV